MIITEICHDLTGTLTGPSKICLHTHTQTHTQEHTLLHTNMHVYTHTHTHTQTHTHAHTHTHIHTYTHTLFYNTAHNDRPSEPASVSGLATAIKILATLVSLVMYCIARRLWHCRCRCQERSASPEQSPWPWPRFSWLSIGCHQKPHESFHVL